MFLRSLNPNYYKKIPSGEITNYPNLKLISKFNKKTLISTGLSNFQEIKKIMKLITKFGLNKKKLFCYSAIPLIPQT